MSTFDWAAYGISWTTEVVSKQNGPNKTDRVAYSTPAQIPVVLDEAAWEKFCAHFGKSAVLAMFMASNSPRVRAQAVNRAQIEAGVKDQEVLRTAVYNAMRGVRAQAAIQTVTVNRYPLVDGSFYEGSDLVEYQQAAILAYVEKGVSVEMATALTADLKLA